MLSDARGTLRIRSADPREPPRLRFNYLSTERDRREWLEAIACARRILGQPAFKPFDGGELSRRKYLSKLRTQIRISFERKRWKVYG